MRRYIERLNWQITKFISSILVVSVILLHFNCFNLKIKAVEPEEIENIIRDGLYSFCEEIDISGYRIKYEELGMLFSLIIKNDPYLFFVSRTLSFSYDSSGTVITLKPKYLFDIQECFLAWEYCRAEVNKIARYATQFCDSDCEFALFVHDYICKHYYYDDCLNNDNIYDFFLKGSGTCQAYTLAYMAVLSELGIESVFAASDEISHIWNLVKIEDEWYHVDLTWNDSASGGHISRRHFLCSDSIAEKRGHKDWYSPNSIKCNSEKYSDAVFTDVWYYDIDHNGKTELFDLMLINKYLSSDVSEGVCLCCADVDDSGKIDETDREHLRTQILMIALADETEKD